MFVEVFMITLFCISQQGLTQRVHMSQDTSLLCWISFFLFVSLTSTMSTMSLCGIKALFGTFLETNMIIARDIYTLVTLCFRSLPRGGPELWGASFLRGTGTSEVRVRTLWSRVRAGSEQGQSRVRVFQFCMFAVTEEGLDESTPKSAQVALRSKGRLRL